MATLVMFSAARNAAGRSTDHLTGLTLGSILDDAVERYGSRFAEVLAYSRIWINGEQADPNARSFTVGPDDEIAILPPISGG